MNATKIKKTQQPTTNNTTKNILSFYQIESLSSTQYKDLKINNNNEFTTDNSILNTEENNNSNNLEHELKDPLGLVDISTFIKENTDDKIYFEDVRLNVAKKEFEEDTFIKTFYKNIGMEKITKCLKTQKSTSNNSIKVEAAATAVGFKNFTKYNFNEFVKAKNTIDDICENIKNNEIEQKISEIINNIKELKNNEIINSNINSSFTNQTEDEIVSEFIAFINDNKAFIDIPYNLLTNNNVVIGNNPNNNNNVLIARLVAKIKSEIQDIVNSKYNNTMSEYFIKNHDELGLKLENMLDAYIHLKIKDIDQVVKTKYKYINHNNNNMEMFQTINSIIEQDMKNELNNLIIENSNSISKETVQKYTNFVCLFIVELFEITKAVLLKNHNSYKFDVDLFCSLINISNSITSIKSNNKQIYEAIKSFKNKVFVQTFRNSCNCCLKNIELNVFSFDHVKFSRFCLDELDKMIDVFLQLKTKYSNNSAIDECTVLINETMIHSVHYIIKNIHNNNMISQIIKHIERTLTSLLNINKNISLTKETKKTINAMFNQEITAQIQNKISESINKIVTANINVIDKPTIEPINNNSNITFSLLYVHCLINIIKAVNNSYFNKTIVEKSYNQLLNTIIMQIDKIKHKNNLKIQLQIITTISKIDSHPLLFKIFKVIDLSNTNVHDQLTTAQVDQISIQHISQNNLLKNFEFY